MFLEFSGSRNTFGVVSDMFFNIRLREVFKKSKSCFLTKKEEVVVDAKKQFDIFSFFLQTINIASRLPDSWRTVKINNISTIHHFGNGKPWSFTTCFQIWAPILEWGPIGGLKKNLFLTYFLPREGIIGWTKIQFKNLKFYMGVP